MGICYKNLLPQRIYRGDCLSPVPPSLESWMVSPVFEIREGLASLSPHPSLSLLERAASKGIFL